MISKKTIVVLISLSVFAVFITEIAVFYLPSEAQSYNCPSGTYTATCTAAKTWCSNRDTAPSTYACGCTCGTGSCQDGNPYTLNGCTSSCTSYQCLGWTYYRPPRCTAGSICTSYGSICSSSSCPSGTADANNNPADGCETNLLTSNSNCGTVGNACAGTATCQSGTCIVPFDFNVSSDPAVGLANGGDVKNANISVSLVVGSGTASISASGAPTGTTVSFSPTSCAPNCYSNMTVNTSASTPVGSSIINVTGTSGSLTRSAAYNITILPSSGIATCGNGVCNSPETQSSCAVECNTTASMPSPVTPSEIVSISVDFKDFRYLANGKVRIDLSIDGTTAWNSANGCSIGGVKLGPTASSGTTAWPLGTTSDNGHFLITALCTVPSSLVGGAHTLSATPTIF